jgi:hypothetical protein
MVQLNFELQMTFMITLSLYNSNEYKTTMFSLIQLGQAHIMAITFSLDQNIYLLQMMHFKVHPSYGLHLFIYHVHYIILPFRMTAHT